MEENVKELIQRFEQDKGKRIDRYTLAIFDSGIFDFNTETYYVIAKDRLDYYLVSKDKPGIETLGVDWSVNSPWQLNKIDIVNSLSMGAITINLFTDKEKEEAVNIIKEKFHEYVNMKEWYEEEVIVKDIDNLLCSL